MIRYILLFLIILNLSLALALMLPQANKESVQLSPVHSSMHKTEAVAALIHAYTPRPGGCVGVTCATR